MEWRGTYQSGPVAPSDLKVSIWGLCASSQEARIWEPIAGNPLYNHSLRIAAQDSPSLLRT